MHRLSIVLVTLIPTWAQGAIVETELLSSGAEVTQSYPEGDEATFFVRIGITAIGGDVFLPSSTDALGFSYVPEEVKPSMIWKASVVSTTADYFQNHYRILEGETEPFQLTLNVQTTKNLEVACRVSSILYFESIGGEPQMIFLGNELVTPSIRLVPEPASLALLGIGAILIAGRKRR